MMTDARRGAIAAVAAVALFAGAAVVARGRDIGGHATATRNYMPPKPK